MTKTTGGPPPPGNKPQGNKPQGQKPQGQKPPRHGARPGKPGAYSQRLINKATAGVRPPRFGAGKSAGKPDAAMSGKPERERTGRRRAEAGEERAAASGGMPGWSKRPERNDSRERAGDGKPGFRVRDRERPRGAAPLGHRDRDAASTNARKSAPRRDSDQGEPRRTEFRGPDSGPSRGRPGAAPRGREGAAHRERPDRDRTAPKPSAPASARPPRVKASPARAPADDTSGSPMEPMRIAKAMARSGLCSRRDAERWIADGRVAVNGRVLATPACDVGPTDRILVDGAPLPAAEPAQIWRYYKPRGLVTTHADPEGRPTVFDSLPPDMPRVVSIGRLDYNTEGLLLLTNDGALARHLELPATGWLRRYRVRAFGRVTQAELDALKEGVTIEGVRYGGIEATLDSVQAGNMWLTLALREGKNREVRRILGSLALEVNRLIRISYGPFQLMDLTAGMIEPVKRRVLADQLGPDAAKFGLIGAIDGYKARQARLKPGQRKDEDEDEA